MGVHSLHAMPQEAKAEGRGNSITTWIPAFSRPGKGSGKMPGKSSDGIGCSCLRHPSSRRWREEVLGGQKAVAGCDTPIKMYHRYLT